MGSGREYRIAAAVFAVGALVAQLVVWSYPPPVSVFGWVFAYVRDSLAGISVISILLALGSALRWRRRP